MAEILQKGTKAANSHSQSEKPGEENGDDPHGVEALDSSGNHGAKDTPEDSQSGSSPNPEQPKVGDTSEEDSAMAAQTPQSEKTSWTEWMSKSWEWINTNPVPTFLGVAALGFWGWFG